MSVFDGKLLKYGVVKGEASPAVPVYMEVSQILEPGMSKFVTIDATTGKAGLTVAADTTIFGHIDAGAVTTADGDQLNCILGNASVVYRVPVLAADYAGVVQAAIGDKCDLKLTTVGSNTTFQTAIPGTSTRGHLIIVGFDPNAATAVGYTWIDAIINPAILGSN